MTREELEALVDAAIDRAGVAIPRAVLKRELVPALAEAVRAERAATAATVLEQVRSRLRKHLSMKDSREIPALMARLRRDLAA